MVSSPVVEGDVLIVAGGAHNRRGSISLRMEEIDGQIRPAVLWESQGGAAPHTSSGILNDGLFFAVTRYGVMTCYDAVTGKRQWRVRLGGRSFAASLVIGDGKIYVTAESGTTSVVAASRKFELLGENFLERGHSSSPAIADGSILLRTEGNLFRIGSGGAEPLPTQTASPSE